jgi:hypothetical protein
MDTETNNNADDKGESKTKNFLYPNAMKHFDFFKWAFVRKIHFRCSETVFVPICRGNLV